MYDRIRNLTSVRLLVLFTSFFFLLLIASGISYAIGLSENLSERVLLLSASIVQALLAFCLPALITAKFSSDHPLSFLSLDRGIGLRAIAGVIIVYILALPALNFLINWNESIHFPEWCGSLETVLREMEDANSGVAEKMLETSSFSGIIINIVVIGILTGFSEELFFRGALQNVFTEGRVSKSVSVWFCAFIFSAIHFQFFGFFPRLLMGAFFGYLLVWTGSLWPCVFAHALNNSIVVVTTALPSCLGFVNPDNFGVVDNDSFPWIALSGSVATALFFYFFKNYFFKPAAYYGKD